MRGVIDELHLKDALTASMDAELKGARRISFEQADDELLVHGSVNCLTHLQEDFMPLGLRVRVAQPGRSSSIRCWCP